MSVVLLGLGAAVNPHYPSSPWQRRTLTSKSCSVSWLLFKPRQRSLFTHSRLFTSPGRPSKGSLKACVCFIACSGLSASLTCSKMLIDEDVSFLCRKGPDYPYQIGFQAGCCSIFNDGSEERARYTCRACYSEVPCLEHLETS